jgi:thioredoxin-like negative regulator of GroEL
MAAIRFRFVFLALALTSLGCGGDPAASLQDARIAANAAYNEAVTAFASKDYAGAEAKLAAALQANVLNPDVSCEATAKYAVCLAAAGKYPEAMAELDKLGPAAPGRDLRGPQLHPQEARQVGGSKRGARPSKTTRPHD